jgi:exoribonuclease II
MLPERISNDLCSLRPNEDRAALVELRESWFSDVLSVGDLAAHTARAASYWRLTDEGRRELERRRSK